MRGAPRIRIVARPRCGYGAGRPELTRGSNHLRFVMPDLTLRLTTDAPIAYVAESVPFVLERPLHLLLGHDVYRAFREKLGELTESVAEWKSVTLDVNFPSE